MKVIFSGTGSSTGAPQLFCDCKTCTSDNPKNKRTRFSMIIIEKETTLLVDTPFELRLQLLKAQIKKVDAIWLTHPHSDHIAGIDDTRIISFKNNGPIPFFAGIETIKNAKTRYPYMFYSNEYTDRPFLEPRIVSEAPVVFKEMELIPVKHLHGSMEVHSFWLKDFAFLADVSEISESEILKLSGIKTLSVCTTVKHPHYKHMELKKVIDLIDYINPETAYLTHMNHTFEYEEIRAALPPNIIPAYDGLEINI